MRAARRRQLLVAVLFTVLGCSITGLAAVTVAGLAPLPAQLPPSGSVVLHARVESRDGTILRRSFRDPWNVHDHVPLHRIPARLREAFIAAEDRRFREHGGPDWRARAAALWQNLRAGGIVRGASTISEQCVRLLHPRPRTPWSRWLEGFDAARLEARFGKSALLEFYLNQVPYADNRRGVVQAARHYFDRDLDTLSRRETLTLAVLVRAPTRLDPWRNPGAADGAVRRLAAFLDRSAPAPRGTDLAGTLALRRPQLDLDAPHLVRHVIAVAPRGTGRIRTTIDSGVQRSAQALLAQRLARLHARGARHGAALVADHRSGAILAWAVATAPGQPPTRVDAITVPRQPGSTLKPFVYAQALEQGWSAATLIDDRPFAQTVGHGQHAYRNYSRVHYGAISVREALANSLNVPAVKALAFVGAHRFLQRLRELGFHGLTRGVQDYGDGLALGNGEVSLLELTGAYATLANAGRSRALTLFEDAASTVSRPLIDAAASSIVADILADPHARGREFGGGMLDLPVHTAVKTGTSSDHRDAWAVGFDHRFVVGVWLGDLERRAMDRISGASGPALVMRALFAHLNRDGNTRPLRLDPRLQRLSVCSETGHAPHPGCKRRHEEWFAPGRSPGDAPAGPTQAAAPRIRQPGNGLHLALDPRLPLHAQRFRFVLAPGQPSRAVEWFVNGERAARTAGEDWLWPMRPGDHRVYARVHHRDDARAVNTPTVTFRVR